MPDRPPVELAHVGELVIGAVLAKVSAARNQQDQPSAACGGQHRTDPPMSDGQAGLFDQ
jgi:hypothetical protein